MIAQEFSEEIGYREFEWTWKIIPLKPLITQMRKYHVLEVNVNGGILRVKFWEWNPNWKSHSDASCNNEKRFRPIETIFNDWIEYLRQGLNDFQRFLKRICL